MPTRVQCGCGKALSVRDELAGKAVKCPACQKTIRVPAAKAAPAPAKSDLDDLFSEEGFDREVAAVCTACGAEMKAGAVLCTKCGFNKETGEYLDGHKTVGVDIDQGTAALNHAAESMQRDADMQKRMHSKAGMPWWMLLVVMFVIASASTLAVLSINASRQEEGTPLAYDPKKLFFTLTGGLVLVLATGAYINIIVNAFKKSRNEGLLSLLTPYILYFAFKTRPGNLKLLIQSLIGYGLGGYLLTLGI